MSETLQDAGGSVRAGGEAAPSGHTGAVWELLEVWLATWMARWMGRRGPAGEQGLDAVARLFDLPESPLLMYLEAVPYLSGGQRRVAARNVARMLRGRGCPSRQWGYALGRTIGSRRVVIRRWRRIFARKINFTRRLGTVFPRLAHGLRVEDHCDPPVGIVGSRKIVGSWPEDDVVRTYGVPGRARGHEIGVRGHGRSRINRFAVFREP